MGEPALRFRGPVLPDGESRDFWVIDSVVTHEPQPGAELAAEGWIVPGLVDAHCHFGMDDGGATDDETTEQQALEARAVGALLIRDCGSPADTRWIQDRADLPRLIRAGRHIARTKRYVRNYADEVEPDGLVQSVRTQVANSDGWIKLVGDWISRETGDLSPSFSAEEFAAAIGAAHDLGAKVTAHTFGSEVLPWLVDAGIDCIEHGTGLTPDLIDRLVANGTALVPTVLQTAKFPEFVEAGRARFPVYAATMEALNARRRSALMEAYEAGVAIYAGTDGGGSPRYGCLPDEILALHEMGMSRLDALGAASWRAREWLGRDSGLDEGAAADFVVFDANPLDDLRVLANPSRVVLRGRIVC